MRAHRKPSVGTFPYWMAWAHPTRTIACISYHGQVPEWPPAPWVDLKEQNLLYASINGDTEWMGTWYRHVRPMLFNYRAHSSWLPHQVVLKGIDHGNYPDGSGSQGWGKPVPAGTISCLRVWDYIALFIDKAIALRVPADADPAAGPVILKAVDPDAGWLVHPRATEVLHGAKWRPIRQADGLFTIVDHVKEPTEVYAEEQGTLDQARLLLPASEVPAAERRGWLWLPDRELAEAWRRLHTVHVQPPAEDKSGP